MTHHSLTRRAVLGGAVVTGSALMAGCSNEGRGGAPARYANAPVALPAHIPYKGAAPDLPGDPDTGLMDGYFSYPADPKVATSSRPSDGYDLKALVGTDSAVPPAMGRNSFWQELNDRLGTTLDLNIVPRPDWGQKFATTVAGGSLPEMFAVDAGIPQLPQFIDATAVDLTPYLSGSAIESYPFLANIPTDTWRPTALNGKIMGVPVPRGVMSTNVMYKRVDLLEPMGITGDPTSFEEFLELCVELTAPQENTWALGDVPLDFIRQMFGIPNAWQEVDGVLTRNFEMEAQSDALEAARKMVEAKVLNPATFSSEASDRKSWFGSGRSYLMFDTFSAWPQFHREQTSGDAFQITAMRTPGFSEGVSPCAWLGNPTYGFSAINLDAEDRVESILQVLDWFAAPFGTEEYLFRVYGREGTHYDLDGTDPVPNSRGASEAALGFRYLTDAPWPIYVPGNRDSTQNWYDAQKTAISYGSSDPTIGLYSETSSQTGGSIDGRVEDLTNDIIQGRKPVSAWADGVATWKRSGGDAIRDELEQALADRTA